MCRTANYIKNKVGTNSKTFGQIIITWIHIGIMHFITHNIYLMSIMCNGYIDLIDLLGVDSEWGNL